MCAHSVTDLPEVAAPDVPAEDTWSVPAEWRRTLHPVRGLDDVPAPVVDGTAYETLLAQHADAVRARLEDPSTEEDLRRAALGTLGPTKRFLRTPQPATPGNAPPSAEEVLALDLRRDKHRLERWLMD